MVGLAGLLGSGRTEVARLLFGADQPDSGKVPIDGKPVSMRAPNAAIGAGIAFCSENRRTEGLVRRPDGAGEHHPGAAGRPRLDPADPAPRQRRAGRQVHQGAGHPPRRPGGPVRNLSGGNQQKVLLARWLITEPRLLILDEPTRGIDVGAKAEIQRLVVSLSDGGMAVLFISAELEEVLRLSHKIGVLRDRRLVAQLANGPEIDRRPDHGDHRERRARSDHLLSRWRALTQHHLFWPVVVLVVLLLVNVPFTPDFFSIEIADGHLYGSLIDILRFGAPLILVALGMTLVIATGGIDLSVGSVVAITGALACLYISEQADQNSLSGVLLGHGARPGGRGRAAACGTASWSPGSASSRSSPR